MEEIIHQLTIFARDNALYAYGILFISAFVENVFPPVPGDTVTLAGAYFVGTGSLSYSGVLMSTTIGSVLGFLALYLVALRFSAFVLDENRNKWIDTRKIMKVNRLFEKYGYGIILANRFLSGIRSVISITAGLTRLNFAPVALLSLVSALLWNGSIIYLGAFIGSSWQEIQEFLDVYNRFVFALMAVIALVAGAVFYFRNRSQSS